VNLLNRLREVVADERELEPVLSFAAGGGACFRSAGEAEYLTGNSNDEVFAKVRFKRGRISSIVPGPPLQSAQGQDLLVERARIETSAGHGTFVVSRPLFSERPLKGVFLWNDVLRLSPCPASAPIGKGLDWFDPGLPSRPSQGHLGPPFPFLLEVRILRSPNPFLESRRTLRQLDTFQYLLTLLLAGRVRFAHWPSGRNWALLRRNELPENNLVHTSFTTNEDGRNDDFLVREHDHAPVFDGDYYDHLWSNDSQLWIPSSLDTDIQLFLSLPQGMSEAFIRACYWYALGIQFQAELSLSTVAFSTAIECLLPRPTSSRCKECSKPLGPGPTQLFNRHVKRYGTVAESLHGHRKALYDVRSALVHGSYASQVDTDAMSVQRHSENHLQLLELVAQRSLINWLRDPYREVWHFKDGSSHQCAPA
jgi:hypothetical protein